MRRSKVTKLHPSQRVALGDVLSVRSPADAAGVRRVSEDQSIWDGLPNVPDVDINMYRLNFMFGDGFDVDTADVWTETIVAAGAGNQALTARQWDATGGHATIVSGDGAADLYQYRKQTAALEFAGSEAKRVWFQSQFSYDVENTDQFVLLGFTAGNSTGLDYSAGDWGSFGFGFWYDPTEGQWYFSWSGIGLIILSLSEPDAKWGPGLVWAPTGSFALGQLNSGMNTIDFNISWERIELSLPFVSWSPVPAITWSINGGTLSDKVLMVSMRGLGPIFLTFGVGNSGSGLNPALRLNYLQYMVEK